MQARLMDACSYRLAGVIMLLEQADIVAAAGSHMHRITI
jgi:hypothetical protein